MTRVASILDGPTGQLLLAARAFAAVGRPLTGEYELRLLSDDRDAKTALDRAVGSVLRDPVALGDFAGPGLLQHLGEISGGFHHGYATKGGQGLRYLESISSILRPLEQAVAGSPSHRWWWSAVADTQVITESATGTHADRQLATYDTALAWWTAPQTTSTVMSTRGPIEEGPSVAAVCGEDLAVDHPQTRVFDTPPGSVFEIRCASDFASLVQRYPRRWRDTHGEWKKMTGADGPWIGPDWEAVARDYAGVHLTVAAYLSTAYRALPVGGGLAHLAGWNPDGTVWFNQPPRTTTW